jgi:hypothetical protein
LWETIKVKIAWKEDGFHGGKGISADRGKPKRPGYTRQTGSIDHIKYFSEETLGTPQEFSWVIEKVDGTPLDPTSCRLLFSGFVA